MLLVSSVVAALHPVRSKVAVRMIVAAAVFVLMLVISVFSVSGSLFSVMFLGCV